MLLTSMNRGTCSRKKLTSRRSQRIEKSKSVDSILDVPKVETQRIKIYLLLHLSTREKVETAGTQQLT